MDRRCIIMDLVERMDMGSSCKISMLWNWYTVDLCFIARLWHVRSQGMFAGLCIGVFLLVVASQWLHRFCREYDAALVTTISQPPASPLAHALSHRWLFAPSTVPLPHHVVRSLLFTVEWGLSYLIMLLFMYYNGYIIILCILGALVGKLLFSYNESICPGSDESDRKCCM